MRISMLAVLFAAACGKSEAPAPACADVVDHTLAVTKINYGGHEGMELGDRKGMIAQCEKDFSPEMRRCIHAAKDLHAVGVCRGKSGAPPSTAPAPTTTPPPAKTP